MGWWLLVLRFAISFPVRKYDIDMSFAFVLKDLIVFRFGIVVCVSRVVFRFGIVEVYCLLSY